MVKSIVKATAKGKSKTIVQDAFSKSGEVLDNLVAGTEAIRSASLAAMRQLPPVIQQQLHALEGELAEAKSTQESCKRLAKGFERQVKESNAYLQMVKNRNRASALEQAIVEINMKITAIKEMALGDVPGKEIAEKYEYIMQGALKSTGQNTEVAK